MIHRSVARWRGMFVACTMVWCGSLALAHPVHRAQARSTTSPVYTTAQADRGADVYRDLCLACHPVETYTGEVFLSWRGRTIADLLLVLEETMPKNDPGSLTPQEYVDVIAYLLRLNRMPAGTTELPTNVKVLQAVRIDVR